MSQGDDDQGHVAGPFRQRNAWRNTIDDAAERQPVDSPKVVTRKSCPIVFPAITVRYCCVCVFT